MHYLTTNEPLDVIVLLCYSFNCVRVSIQLLAAIQINQLIDWLTHCEFRQFAALLPMLSGTHIIPVLVLLLMIKLWHNDFIMIKV